MQNLIFLNTFGILSVNSRNWMSFFGNLGKLILINRLFHMQSQPLFIQENLKKSLFLVFEIELNIMIFRLKPLHVQ